ncbi:MAG: ABC transporter ATP-binding protein, partial [Lentisphaerae bacterium]|nr:ABC transporter ATP-binding protein [Lentisphaerota bacterium]
MSANIAISVKGVTKEFVLRSAVGTRTLKSAVLGIVKSRRGKRFKALDDISFDVNTGETLGIIGANGAGKSTLLSIVAGTMAATSGQVNTHGTISS